MAGEELGKMTGRGKESLTMRVQRKQWALDWEHSVAMAQSKGL